MRRYREKLAGNVCPDAALKPGKGIDFLAFCGKIGFVEPFCNRFG